MVEHEGREYRVIARLNPLYRRSALKDRDVIELSDSGIVTLPDPVKYQHHVTQVREPGGEWKDI